jgi:hypothetical protein
MTFGLKNHLCPEKMGQHKTSSSTIQGVVVAIQQAEKKGHVRSIYRGVNIMLLLFLLILGVIPLSMPLIYYLE